MKDSIHTIVYSAVLGIVCAALLAGAARLTRPYRESNARAEEMRNILEVLDVPFDPRSTSRELESVFQRNVRVADRDGLTTYTYIPSGGDKAEAFAFAFAGPGLWGPVKGFLSLQRDMTTIRGVTFHEHEETPGLGGEISAAWFRDQFNGKSIIDSAGNAGIRIVQDEASKPNEVDAITGATMTSQLVENMLNTAIRRITEEPNHHGK